MAPGESIQADSEISIMWIYLFLAADGQIVTAEHVVQLVLARPKLLGRLSYTVSIFIEKAAKLTTKSVRCKIEVRIHSAASSWTVLPRFCPDKSFGQTEANFNQAL
jgi:hypothetical protein